MNNPGTTEFLSHLEGTDITLNPSPPYPPLPLPHQTWVIETKLSEHSQPMTQQDMTAGLGVPYAAAKFLCHRKENPNKKAFMRIYLQIPVIGTQFQPSQLRRKQAAKPQPHVELATLKALKILGATLCLTSLLMMRVNKARMVSSRGYITSVVWDKVPGQTLDAEEFWKLDLESRQAIREKFREVYP